MTNEIPLRFGQVLSPIPLLELKLSEDSSELVRGLKGLYKEAFTLVFCT